MSLQFVFGNSGSGKSDYLYETVLKKAQEEPNRNFLILVPEQFTMQTQRELVLRQKNHAIMNVDVLSFARLAYRVFDELGKQDLVILEETGKNLVLRKVAEQKRNELRVLGGAINRMGYIGELKSFLSELTQYHVSPEDLEGFLEEKEIGEALRLKMRDVLTMYRGFREYMEGKYITSEEVLTLLSAVAGESALLRDSCIVFDEFTGFTPVQNHLLRQLLVVADKLLVSVTMDIREDFYVSKGIHELFAMSKKTVEVLRKTAAELSIEVLQPIVLTSGEKKRYKGAPELFFMEQNLFRPGALSWKEETDRIRVTELKNPREELVFVAREITRLVREKGYCYKDMAVVTGDVTGYANYVPEIFPQYEIPYFIDKTENILFHPLIELIRAALEVVEYDFSYEGMFRFLRSGLVAPILKEDEIDLLENYVLEKGIRGKRRWEETWRLRPQEKPQQENEDEVNVLPENRIKERIFGIFIPLYKVFSGKNFTVEEQTYSLYQFLCSLQVESQLKKKEQTFLEQGNQEKAKEYAQIYKIVMDLLDKVASLLGDERISVREYREILDAGFLAAKVGVIPPGNDKVTIGDIERTRLNHIKILFFVGVNDGVVPKKESRGSLLSQFEREKIQAHQLKLAPSAREQVFIQKFYLYLNMTKPSDALYLTFSLVGTDGKALRRSYLVGTIQRLFPKLAVEELVEEEQAGDIRTPVNAMRYFLEGLQKGADFSEEWKALASWYLSKEDYREEALKLIAAAFSSQANEPIGKAVTRALYGTSLENSVTRLERFAACAFAHYLDYGLCLRERRLHQFATVDMGNIYHDALEYFAKRVEASEHTWFALPEELQAQWIDESMEDAIASHKEAGLFEDARNRYLLERMKGTLQKTIWALLVQLQQGKFVPSAFEVSFSEENDLNAVRFTLGEEERMRLRGRIDRVDTYETKDKVYVKIIDYKSGNTTFSLLNLYHGLQLQLVVYLNVALELEAKRHPGKQAVAAGIFYSHVEHPMIEGDGTEADAEIRRLVLEKLKPNGLVNEGEEIYRAMDSDFSGNSAVIPIGIKSDGTLKATSATVTTEEFELLSAYVNQVLEQSGKEILSGKVETNPYRLEGRTACEYCAYHSVCCFDDRMPGYSYRELQKFDNAETILENMRRKERE